MLTAQARSILAAMNDQPAAGHNPYRARSLRHQLLARLLEIVLTPMDIAVESEVPVMSEPPRADVLLLRRRGKAWTTAQRDLLPDGVRDRNAQHHLLECKFSESLNAAAVQQALSYDYFYRQTHQLKIGELQTYVVSARTPRPAWLQQFGYTVEQAGVYASTQPLAAKVVVLVLNELSDAPHNEFLRLFAAGSKCANAASTKCCNIRWACGRSDSGQSSLACSGSTNWRMRR